MPKALERKLMRQARKMHLTGERRGAYIYGTIRKVTGWRPKREKK